MKTVEGHTGYRARNGDNNRVAIDDLLQFDLGKQSVALTVEVLWVDVDSGETHEGVLKARYGDQVPPGLEFVTIS